MRSGGSSPESWGGAKASEASPKPGGPGAEPPGGGQGVQPPEGGWGGPAPLKLSDFWNFAPLKQPSEGSKIFDLLMV